MAEPDFALAVPDLAIILNTLSASEQLDIYEILWNTTFSLKKNICSSYDSEARSRDSRVWSQFIFQL